MGGGGPHALATCSLCWLSWFGPRTEAPLWSRSAAQRLTGPAWLAPTCFLCPQDRLRFPRMLMKLVSLRTLSSVHSEQVFALRLQDKKLPPLLSEIWDVHE